MQFINLKNIDWGTSLVVQWLILHAFKTEDQGSIPGQGTRSHVLQLDIPHAIIKTWCSQINKYWGKKEILRITLYSILWNGLGMQKENLPSNDSFCSGQSRYENR